MAGQKYGSDDIIAPLERFGALLRTPVELSVLLQSVCAQVVATIPSADMFGVTIFSAADRLGDGNVYGQARPRCRRRSAPGERRTCLEGDHTQQVDRAWVDGWPALAGVREECRRKKSVAGMGVANYLAAPLTADNGYVGP